MAFSPLGIKYLQAIDDWKAPFEVAKIVGTGRPLKTVAATLHAMVGRGLAEYGRANNTFRLTEAGRLELHQYQQNGRNDDAAR